MFIISPEVKFCISIMACLLWAIFIFAVKPEELNAFNLMMMILSLTGVYICVKI